MKLLAIESSSLVASVALAEDEAVLAGYSTNFKKTHSRTLMPMIDEIIKMTETGLESIDAIAVSKGPGSFTGLRIGAATAKGLALSLNKKIIPVSTILAMAYNFYGYDKGLIVPLMDARRDQVYTGIYKFNACDEAQNGAGNEKDFEPVIIMEDTPLSITELLEILNEKKEEVIFLGDGVPAFEDEIRKLAKFSYMFAPINLNRQRAESFAKAAFDQFKKEGAICGEDFSPEYFRPSQAEREKNKDADA